MEKKDKKEKKYVSIFGNNPDISFAEKFRVTTEIQKLGGLTFDIKKSKDGWMAQCVEVPAIITGNTNPHPTAVEIESQTRDAIFAAFNVKVQKPEIKRAVLSPLQQADVFEYKVDPQNDGKQHKE